MAAFTDNWDSDRSSDDTNATEIDDYINKLATDIEERLKNWVYGYVSGENDGIGGLIYAKLKEQASTPTTPASVFGLVAKDDSGTCLYGLPESGGTAVKILNASAQIPAGAYAADSIDQDDIRLANNANLTGRNNAGDGDISILKVNTSDGITMGAVTTLPDTSALATSGAPTADAQLANKKYVDDSLAMSAYTNLDSDENAMVQGHSYLAATAGFVAVRADVTAAGRILEAYVATAAQWAVGNDPTTDGIKVGSMESADTSDDVSLFFAVAEGEYFEIVLNTDTPTIYWKSVGTLSKPVDQD